MDNEIILELKKIVGEKDVLVGEQVSSRMIHVWYQEPIEAMCIVRPESTDQVSKILAFCNKKGQSLVPHGGLTGLVQGCNVDKKDVVISLEKMNQIEEIDPIGRTMTVQAGVPLQTLQETAENHDLMFPMDLGARGSCQIGGNVSTNAGGNRVIRFGMTRENVLGLEAVLADGTVVSSMNTMIKNNAGYDLKQLFIGSEGTLGIVTRIVVRLREAPQTLHTGFAAFDSFNQLTDFLRFIDRELGGSLSAFEVMWKDYYELVTTAPATNTRPVPLDYPNYVLLEALGTGDEQWAVMFEEIMGKALSENLVSDAAIAQSESDRKAMWRIRDSVEEWFRYGPAFIYDVSLGIRYMENYIAEVKTRLGEKWPEHRCFTVGHIGDGNIHFAIHVGGDSLEEHAAVNECVYEPLQPIGGSISAEHGIGTEKKDYLKLSRSDNEVQLMRKLKMALDPKGILNPSKIFAT